MNLTPAQQARAFLEARIQILVDEAVATSALEGIRLNRTAVRRAVIRRLGLRATEDADRRHRQNRTPEEQAEFDAAIEKVVESFPPRSDDDFDSLVKALLEKWKR